MDWKEYFSDSKTMIATLQKRIEQDRSRIRYVNVKIKAYNKPESRWLSNVSLEIVEPQLMIHLLEQDQKQCFLLEEIEYMKFRPFYYAACIGFKEFLLYCYPEDSQAQDDNEDTN